MIRRVFLFSALLLLACSDTPADDGDASPEDASIDVTRAPDASDAEPDDADAGPALPSPIRYVLVLVKENHTFDNYFTGFPGADTTTTAKLSTGKTYTRPVAASADLKSDMCHANSCGFDAYDNGKMDGFDTTGTGTQGFAYYTEKQIPSYWQYARNFVLADHFFSTTLGPSTPGHTVFWNGRSLSIANAACPLGGDCNGFGCTAGKDVTIASQDSETCETAMVKPCFDVPILSDHLPEGFTWMDYGGPIAMMTKSVVADPNYITHFAAQKQLVTDLGNGKLANLTIAHLSSGDTSEHPPSYPCAGENFTVQIVNAAMQSPHWKEMAIVITWDDWGGFYDHVAPTVHKCKNGKIYRSGFRLPAIVISPYAKKGYVLKTPTEQASVPRLVEELWGMPFMTARSSLARDGVAGSLMDAFDFAQAPRDPLILQTHTCP
ncbi:MAG TPA: alkaline phosphatase family protein [Polyangiaceae bacterium]|jgi:phospholipase C